MRRSFPAFIAIIALLTSADLLRAAPPRSFQEVQDGIREAKQGVDDPNLCGGWGLPPSSSPAVTPDCTVEIACQGGACDGQAGFTNEKDDDGRIEVCIQEKGGGGEAYTILHELQHAKQLCPLPPHTQLINGLRTCCVYEREAYQVDCDAMEKDGVFRGTPVTEADCVDIGSSFFNCAQYHTDRPRWNVCGDGTDIPVEKIASLSTTLANLRTPSCSETKANPDPRVALALEEIRSIGEAAPGSTTVPIPTVTGAPGHRNENPLYSPASGVGLRAPFEYPDTSGTHGLESACDVHDSQYNPDQLCLGEKRTPDECRQLYQHLLELQGSLPRRTKCGFTEKLCVDFTDECTGAGCEKPGPPSFSYTPPECHVDPDTGELIIDKPEEVVAVVRPFYRHYDVSATVPSAPQNDWQLDAECYDYYREDDSKVWVMTAAYEQCELTIKDDSRSQHPEWLPREKQRAQYKADPPLKDPDDPVRPERSVPSPWVADPHTNLSLLNGSDPLHFLPFTSVPIEVKQRASKTTLDAAYTDAFDDTGDRTVVHWWNNQQRELARLLHQPAVHLTLPARFLYGLDADDPIIRLAESTRTRSNGTVEVTIHAGPDELAAVIASLQRSLILPITEVRIPLLVPLVSETEITGRIFEWRSWQLQHPDQRAAADPLIEKLEGYRRTVAQIRLIRNVLPVTLERAMTAQRTIRSFAASWYQKNAERLLSWASVANVRANLRALYGQITNAMLETTDCQLNWCSNQRYSVPVYGLLDDWLPGRWSASGRKLPDLRDLHYLLPPDLTIDLSRLDLRSAALQIPVLDPTEVRLRLPLPPAEPGGAIPPADQFPDLPPLDLSAFSSLPTPDVAFPNGIARDPSDPSGAAFTIADDYLVPPSSQDVSKLLQAQTMLWEIYGFVSPADRSGMKGSYCRFTKSLLAPKTPRKDKIVHVENELTERVARLFARYEPNIQPDFSGHADRLTLEYGARKPPCKADLPCPPPAAERATSLTWQWLVSAFTQSAAIDAITQAMRTSLPVDAARNPYFDSPLPLLQRLFPLLPLPITIDLLPTPSS